jgi:hypothetical protein
MMGNWDRSSFEFALILSDINTAGISRGAMLHGFLGTIAPYILLITAVLTVRSAI